MKKALVSFFVFLFIFGAVSLKLSSSVYAQSCDLPNASGVCPPNKTYLCAPGTLNAGKCCNTDIACTVASIGGKWYSPSFMEFYNKVYGSPDQEIFGERYTFAQVVWIINSLNLLFNINLTSDENIQKIQQFFAQVNDGQSPELANYQPFGISGMVVGLISQIYTHPAGSGVQYLASGLEKFNLVQPAYAQGGYGYNNNTLILPLWKASRNVCYFLMVILLIAAGFMIMFRVKVNAQTAVSIQVMIPKIIITLILITFSYAIAGLMIDLVYLVLTLFLSMLSVSGVGVVSDLGSAVKFFTGSYWNVTLYYMVSMLANTLLNGAVAALMTIPGIGVLIGIILSIMVFWLLLKVWWMLMQTYISIVLSFVIAPWQILLDLMPGGKGFSSWLRNLIANAAVFIVTPLMFLLSVYLSNPVNWGILTSGINWLIPLGDRLSTEITGVANAASSGKTVLMPLFGSGAGLSGSFGFFMSLAILALIPKVSDMIKKALKASTFGYGSAFGEALNVPPARSIASSYQQPGVELAKAKAEADPTNPYLQRKYSQAQSRQKFVSDLLSGKNPMN